MTVDDLVLVLQKLQQDGCGTVECCIWGMSHSTGEEKYYPIETVEVGQQENKSIVEIA